MIDSVYNYLATSQISRRSPKSLSRQTTHERKELKQLYNNIININKHAPLYLIKLSTSNQNHALGIKEASMDLHSTLADISDIGTDSIFSHKKSHSQNESSASATIITHDYSLLPKPFELHVASLACTQANESLPLYSNSQGPSAGSYHFTIEIEDVSYEFQFHIASNSRNLEIESKLADFINKTDIGIKATLKTQENNDQLTLLLESNVTGNVNGLVFRLHDTMTPENAEGIVEFYDLNNVIAYPQNAQFEINGEPKESMSNSFILNQSLNISLHSVSNQPFSIEYVPDGERILTSITQVIDSFNHLINLAEDYPSKQYLSSKLIHDIGRSISTHCNKLESCGLSQDNNGSLKLDQALAIQSIKDGDMKDLFTSADFVPSLMRRLDSITINPMEYVDKTIVTYPNTSTPGFGKSYITSMYSGMLFNYYC